MELSTDQINALNQKCYNAVPNRWLRFPFSNLLPIWIKTHLAEKPRRKALEIGAGNGILAEWLQKEGFEILCIDPSEEMIRRCQARGLTTVQSTIQTYEPKELYDAVFAICSLLHVPKSECPAQLQKIAACLKKGGLFICSFIEGSKEGIEEEETGFPRFFAKYQTEEILPLLEKDFQLLQYERIPIPEKTYLLFALRHN